MPQRLLDAISRASSPGRRRLGHRGSALLSLGTLWIGMGVLTILAPAPPGIHMLALAPTVRGTVWILTGAAAIIMATRRQGHDAWGFLALMAMAAYRATAHIAAVLTELLAPTPDGDLPRAVFGAIVWATIARLIVLIAGWPEPVRAITRADVEAALTGEIPTTPNPEEAPPRG
ncbi:hypothetical protein [Micrococcus sp.]|uniref:hypothetical protein n=1 Tax=Micrococcus sp. TaxID=1271 RepID=UPI002A90B793|nr:hypothetical protein [Micrococcus sp.]MDY6054334.1 hypothetical protein [Micrococcus sp.]